MATPTSLHRSLRWLTDDDAKGVVRGSLWMLSSTAAVALGSFVFWAIADARADAETVGRAASLFSASFFIAYLASLGLPETVGRFAGRLDPAHTTRFRLALVTSLLGTGVAVTIFAALDPGDILDPVNQRGRFAGWLLFWALVAGLAASVLVDTRLMGLRRWPVVFGRSVAIALVRLPFVAWAATDSTGFWLFVVAAGGFAVTALPLIPGLVRGPRLPQHRYRDHPEAVAFARAHYASQLALQAPFFVTPFLVALAVSDADNATFYLSWGIMSVVWFGVNLLGRTLLTEGSQPGVDNRRQTIATLRMGFALSLVAIVVSIATARLIVDYVYRDEHDRMRTILPLLMLGTLPWVVTRTAIAVARVRRLNREALALATIVAVSIVGSVAIGLAVGGITAAAVGWVVGGCIPLVVSVPFLRRHLSAAPT